MTEDYQIEQERIKLAINGDRAAFSELLKANYTMIYRVAFKWCGNASDAEDIAQDVCIKLGRSIKNFRNDSSFSSWVYRITLNTVRDMQRSKQSDQQKISAMALISEQNYNPDREGELTQNQLWDNVKMLPEKQRDAVLLVHAEGLNHKEAAEIMECSESTVSWHIHEAKKKLKSLFAESEG